LEQLGKIKASLAHPKVANDNQKSIYRYGFEKKSHFRK
jgi:hypothetical protein